uniref:4-vinyl reductase 4VR domain-containing protein n=1 Tax=Caldiarchaeum subterraneum TaxID=311458 RepID=A0A7J3VRL1_CALS0
MDTANVKKDAEPLSTTGHSVFDQIFKLKPGMTVLVADETFSEGYAFLKALLKKRWYSVVEVVSARYLQAGAGQAVVSTEGLQDLSIHVNQRRRQEKGKILLHTYLPELLVRHNPDEVLKLFEIWQKDVSMSKTVEFYLIPKNTFTDFEKKARAIVDSVIDLSVVRHDSQFVYYMMPIRGCDPQFHLKNIRYEIIHDKLLVEWNGVLVDELPEGMLSIESIKKMLESKEDRLLLTLGDVRPDLMPLSDYVVLTGLEGSRLSTFKSLYPDVWPEIEEKLAGWIASGAVKIVEAEPEPSGNVRSRLRLKSRLLLMVPTGLALRLVLIPRIFLRKKVQTVPLEAHLAVLEAMRRVIEYASAKRPDFLADARAATYYFGQLSARKTALEYVRRLEGSNPGKFEARHVPKLVALTLKAGWGLDVSFTASTKNSLVFDVKKCHLCEGVSSDSPFCDKFVSGVVVGVLSVCLKTKVDCFEITCRAMGADRCSFKATIL